MRKLYILLCMAVLTLSTLSACGGSGTEPSKSNSISNDERAALESVTTLAK